MNHRSWCRSNFRDRLVDEAGRDFAFRHVGFRQLLGLRIVKLRGFVDFLLFAAIVGRISGQAAGELRASRILTGRVRIFTTQGAIAVTAWCSRAR